MSGRLPNGTWVALLVLWGGAFALAAANAPQWIAGILFVAGLGYLILVLAINIPWWRRNWWWVIMAMSAAGKIIHDLR